MLAEFTAWLLGLIGQLFTEVGTFLSDLVLSILDGFLQAVAALLALLPVPDWMGQGLQPLFAQLDPGVVFFLSQFGLFQALGVLGTAVAFRLGRKVITLFQW